MTFVHNTLYRIHCQIC